MSTTRKVHDLPTSRIGGNQDAINSMIGSLVNAGVVVHHAYDAADTIDTPDASDLASSQALAQALAEVIPTHGADTNAHDEADSIDQAAAWTSAPDAPADLTEVQNVLNELKADINAHVANATPHRAVWGAMGGDGVLVAHAITTADAIDQGSANALANALKAFFNAHIRAAEPLIEVTPS